MKFNRNREFLRYVVDQEADGGGSEPPADPPPADPAGVDDLGDPGKKALDAMKEREKAARARARQLEQENADLKAAAEAKDKPAEEAALDAARREGETAAMARANERLLAAEVRAAAAGKLNDPTDALRLLDLSAFEVGADGVVDTEAIADAIDGLIKAKPYLQATPQRRPAEGSADGGTRKAESTGKTREQLIAEANKRGDWRAVMALETSKLVDLADAATSPTHNA